MRTLAGLAVAYAVVRRLRRPGRGRVRLTPEAVARRRDQLAVAWLSALRLAARAQAGEVVWGEADARSLAAMDDAMRKLMLAHFDQNARTSWAVPDVTPEDRLRAMGYYGLGGSARPFVERGHGRRTLSSRPGSGRYVG